jgi:dTDP-4-dehydrorhamnose reductase
MESSSNKIILLQYKIKILDLQFSDFLKRMLEQTKSASYHKIVKYYISSITESNLIIEVILKDL